MALVEEAQVLRAAMYIHSIDSNEKDFADLANLNIDPFRGMIELNFQTGILALLYDYDQTNTVLTAAERKSVYRNLAICSLEQARRINGNCFGDARDWEQPSPEHIAELKRLRTI